MNDNSSVKVALVLGGGGSRGIAHIGVIDVLQRENVPIDLIVGTSMGAIVGLAFALGHSPSQIADQLRNLSNLALLSMNIFSARARQRNLSKKLGSLFGERTFSHLKIPAVAMTVDVHNGQEVAIEQESILKAVLASCAVPALFPPVDIDGRLLADGGIIDSLATHIAHHKRAKYIIAVDVYPPLDQENPWNDPLNSVMGIQLPSNAFVMKDWSQQPSMMSALWRASRIMTWYTHVQRLDKHPPDVLIRPEVGDYSTFAFKDLDGPLNSGRESTEAVIDRIKRDIDQLER